MYCEGTIRRKAYEIGYQVEKGFQHWQGEFVYHDSYGDRYSGYMVKNLYTGFYEWGCYLNKVLLAEEDGTCSTEFHVLRVKDKNVVLPSFLAAVMRSDIILVQTKHMMTGNTHPRISNEDVKNLCIPIPAIDVQREIVAELENNREKARRLKSEADREWAEAKAQFERELLGET